MIENNKEDELLIEPLERAGAATRFFVGVCAFPVLEIEC